MLVEDKKESVSVIIPCHNYAHYLADCLQSVIGQTHTPSEIIVVDDDSTDEPEKIVRKFKFENLHIIKVSNRNVAKTQNDGIRFSNGDYICCLDADDSIDPFYIEQALKVFKEDYRIGVVYSDYEYQGLMHGVSSFPASSLENDIHRSNFIHTGAMFKKELALLTNAFEHGELGDYAMDWLVWRKMLHQGHWAVKQDARYYYRRHEESWSMTRFWKVTGPTYFETAALSEEVVTLAIVVDDHMDSWKYQLKFLKDQTWDPEKIRLLVLYAGGSNSGKILRDQVLELSFGDIQFTYLPLDPSLQKTERECAIASKIAQEADTPYLLFLDEYIVPPNDVIKKLLDGMSENTVSVSSDFSQRSWGIVALKKGERKKIRETRGIHETSRCGFSCVLVRSQYFREVFNSNRKKKSAQCVSPEYLFYTSLEQTFNSRINCNAVSRTIFELDQAVPVTEEMKHAFDEEYYLEHNHDVMAAVEKGEYKTGLEHFLKYGTSENRLFRLCNRTFDEGYYLKHNPDVKRAVEDGILSSGSEHYFRYGEKEGRNAFFY